MINIPQILQELAEINQHLSNAKELTMDAMAEIAEAKVMTQSIELQMGLLTLEVESLEGTCKKK